jgi:peptidoglycan/LPS O-acetylase OafA/YrhL/lysophospholipase L1-like esterase
MSKRVASLDLLRGAAAFSVAIPHYFTLNSTDWPIAEAIAIAAVEVFFVLSGFVLAQQILYMVMGNPAANLRVFLIRRWMRTIPPFLLALLLISLLTNETFTAGFFRYAGYIQNLFYQANSRDYFPVAWSLAVEEWFYVSFAPLIFLLARVSGRTDRKFAAIVAIAFILSIVILRAAYFSPDHWDAEVRRVTIFRIDSIAWGFLLYLVLERPAAAGVRTARGSLVLSLLAALFVACGALCGWAAYLTTTGSTLAKQLFPYAAAGAGLSAVTFFREAEPIFARPGIRSACFLLGHISYSVYLFHMIAVLVLKPRLAGLGYPLQILVYLTAIFAFTLAFWAYFEKAILDARPRYGCSSKRRPVPENAQTARVHKSRKLAAVAAALALAAGYLLARSYEANGAILFYCSSVVLAAALAALVRSSRLGHSALLMMATRTLLLFASLLPAADFAFERSRRSPAAAAGPVKPAYSFIDAKADPQAFSAWWAYYVDEWTKKDGGKASTEAPDPHGVLPFIMKPGSSGRFFDSIIRVNNFGFRGRDMAKEKGGSYRIFALGESPTFGPTLRPGERPWPDMLQSLIDARLDCKRPVEVVNAGTEAYNLSHNLERVRRDIVPLAPDLVLSYHGYNGLRPLGLLKSAPLPHHKERASPLFNEVQYRINLAHRLRQDEQATGEQGRELRSRYASLYRELIDLGRTNGFRLVLGTSSMAVNDSSPKDVKDFYGAVFSPIDGIISANAAHNRMVRQIAGDENISLIETAPDLDGVWDQDLYLDLVHFTEKGNERIAGTMFEGLLPILRDEGGPHCALK